MPPAVEAQSLNHWTAREVPKGTRLESGFYQLLDLEDQEVILKNQGFLSYG